MSSHLEKARNNWDAVLTVPKKLRGVNNLPMLRFRKSTGTADKRKACTIASQYVAGWKILIEEARGNDSSHLSRAMMYRRELEKPDLDDNNREAIEFLINDEAETLYYKTNSEAARSKAIQFTHVASGAKTTTDYYYEQWKAQLTISPRTVEQYAKDVQLFINKFPIIENVNKREVSIWLDKLSFEGVSKDTQKRIIKGCRNYWKYLSRYNINGMVTDPFHQVILANKGKKKAPRETFEPHELVDLWTKAKNSNNDTLADLIVLGAYTGARIDELCSIMVKDVSDDVFNITDSKTTAGIRTVPIHSHIKPVIERLLENSTDGYLLPNLTFDKFGKRSNTIGNQFSKLKKKAGYNERKVFHSLRHTLVTNLVNAGVLEFHIADIIGHEKRGVTGSVYTKALSIEVKRDAIEKISYPFPQLC